MNEKPLHVFEALKEKATHLQTWAHICKGNRNITDTDEMPQHPHPHAQLSALGRTLVAPATVPNGIITSTVGRTLGGEATKRG